jgi:nucleotide-binding universal stress UspA family protein
MTGIVVGVDGSKGSRRALEFALDEAQAHGESLCVVHAYPVSLPCPPGQAPPANTELVHRAQELVREMLDESGAAERPVELTTEVVAIRDNAARALVNAARGASLLVVGSRGLEGFAGLLMGSVSQQCVQHATCPVAVIPHTD